MKKVRKNGLSGATAIVTPLIFLMSLATRRVCYDLFKFNYSATNGNKAITLARLIAVVSCL